MWLRPFKVIVVSAEGGLIEPIPNAISLHQVKKQCSGSLKEYFLKVRTLLGQREGGREGGRGCVGSVYVRMCVLCLAQCGSLPLEALCYGMLRSVAGM